jgi:hypothetical protein
MSIFQWSPKFNSIDTGKNHCLFGCFLNPVKSTNLDSRLDNVNLFCPGVFVSDDVTARPPIKIGNEKLDDFACSTRASRL